MEKLLEQKISDDITIFVKIKYGEIHHSKEFLRSLPVSAVNDAFSQVSTTRDFLYNTKIDVLSILLRQPEHKESVKEAILCALIKYHNER